jgi:outer membrane protein assembly factor BamB
MTAFRRLGLAAFLLAATGADWPQFLGPDRNGTSPEKGLLDSWTATGPPVVWEKEVGEGFSSPVIRGGRLILFHRVGDEEIVECLGAATGKEIWRHKTPTNYDDPLGKGNGPRSTPAIAGDHVYTLSPGGLLLCLKLSDGTKVWQRALLEDYEVPPSYFGVGTSPLVEGNLMLVNVGGKDAGIVAFDKASGKEVWKATGQGASYASPIAATLDGVRHVLFFTREGLASVDPANGTVRFSKRWRARINASVNAASPIVFDNHVFLSACYNTGAILLRVQKDGVDEVWSNDESLSCHFNTPVYLDGHLYGFHGRQDIEGGRLRCVEAKTGKVKWEAPGRGVGSLLLADGRLIVLTEGGDLLLVEPDPEKYREKARATVLGKPCRAHPALAEGRLYARDDRRLVCWDMKKKPGGKE